MDRNEHCVKTLQTEIDLLMFHTFFLPMFNIYRQAYDRPHVLKLYGYAEVEEKFFVVMELCKTSLQSEIKATKNGLSATKFFDFALQIAEGMHELHRFILCIISSSPCYLEH